MKNKLKFKHSFKWHLRNILLMTAGMIVGTAGYDIFIAPNHLLSGGIWGASAIINHFVPAIPMPVFIVLLNAPLLLWGWKRLQLRFAVYTVYVIVAESILLSVFEHIVPTYTGDVMLACIFGGLMTGIGSGVIVRYNSSEGGTEVVGILLKDKLDVSVSTVNMSINAVVVLGAAFIFGFEPALYTLINMFVANMVFGKILEGFNTRRNMLIVTEKGEEMAAALIHVVGRGVTIMKGEGAYTHRDKQVLFCVASRLELSAFKEVVKEVDEHAFVCINRTYDILGYYPRIALSDPKRQQARWSASIEDDED